MTKNLNSFWVRLGSVFLTFYFLPVSNFIRSVLGMSPLSGSAVAGTLTYGGKSVNCVGVSSQTMVFGRTYTCTCETDSSKKMDVMLSEWREERWEDQCSCIQEYGGVDIIKTACYTPQACSPNGSTADCSTTSRYGTKTCQNGKWSSCVWGDCKSGYVMVDSEGGCVASCDIANGEGYETDRLSTSSSSEA